MEGVYLELNELCRHRCLPGQMQILQTEAERQHVLPNPTETMQSAFSPAENRFCSSFRTYFWVTAFHQNKSRFQIENLDCVIKSWMGTVMKSWMGVYYSTYMCDTNMEAVVQNVQIPHQNVTHMQDKQPKFECLSSPIYKETSSR